MAFQAHVFPYGKYCSTRNRKLFSGSDDYQMHNSVKHKKQSFLGVHFFRKIQETDGNCELKGLIHIFNMQLNACSMTTFYVLFAKFFLFQKKNIRLFFVLFCFVLFFMKNNTYYSAATTALYATAARTKSQKVFSSDHFQREL